MLVERYAPVNLFELVPLERDPVLDELDRLLDEDALFQAIKQDLSRRCARTLTRGRPSTPVEVILRLLVVKALYHWSYEETEMFVRDSITLRQFCRIYLHAVPDDTVLIRWANLIQPATVHQLLEHVVQLAQREKVTRGRKLRTDGTVVESNIHYPTDSSLLVDGVRVLSRTLRQAAGAISATGGEVATGAQALFRNRLRSARHVAREISRITRRGVSDTTGQCRRAYRRLLKTARASIRQGQAVAKILQDVTTGQAQALVEQFTHVIGLVEQVVEQTVRRVLAAETVPAAEKVVSLFEPHAAVIRRGKTGKPTEFGHKVWLDEVDGGIVSDYRVLAGNPPDKDQWQPSLEHHRALFGRPPQQASGDRGLYSADNEAQAQTLGVSCVILPKPGRRSDERKRYEQQRRYRRGRRYHQGIEGRISILKRRYGLDRCLYHGEDGFERWVGWGIIAHNLRTIGISLAAR